MFQVEVYQLKVYNVDLNQIPIFLKYESCLEVDIVISIIC